MQGQLRSYSWRQTFNRQVLPPRRQTLPLALLTGLTARVSSYYSRSKMARVSVSKYS